MRMLDHVGRLHAAGKLKCYAWSKNVKLGEPVAEYVIRMIRDV